MSIEGVWNWIKQRIKMIICSWRALPLWVEFWVVYLLIANLLCVFGTSVQAQAIGICGLFILVTNTAVVIIWAGFTKVMSFFHLIAWIPLVIYLILSLILPAAGIWTSQELELWSYDWFLTIIVIITNTISLVFDILDCYRYIKGDRAVPGHGIKTVDINDPEAGEQESLVV